MINRTEIQGKKSMFTFKSLFQKKKLINLQYYPLMLRNMCKTNFTLKGRKYKANFLIIEPNVSSRLEYATALSFNIPLGQPIAVMC